MFFHRMACDTSFNCSSRGSCLEGVCVCSVQFAGDQCSQTNVGFVAAFSSLYSLLVLVSFIQLILCIQAEYKKLKHPSLWSACRITTQKLLYLLALSAALTRVLYFSLMGVIPDKWLNTMELAYQPLLITGMSLVVCYWSEAFFLEDVSMSAARRARFLSKSWLAFSAFNLILYLTVIAQFIVVVTGAQGIISVDHWTNGAFQSFFAIILFIVFIIFMTVGVEIFFKVRGAFNRQEDQPTTSTSSSQTTQNINWREVVKSRLAIVFQALFLLLMVVCIVSKAVETMWRDKVDIKTRSIHTVLHRMAEVLVVLWFPCVLWNSSRPEQLWFLNPRRLLSFGENRVVERLLNSHARRRPGYSTFNIPDEKLDNDDEESECWICYDHDNSETFISPCLCKGGMAKVHHSCLQRWLMENTTNGESPSCNICKYRYAIHEEPVRMLSWSQSWRRIVIIIPTLVLCGAAPYLSVYVFRNQPQLSTPIKVVILGFSILMELVCLRVLGVNFSRLYHITRQSAIRILNYESVNINQQPHEHKSQTKSSLFRKIKPQHYTPIPSHDDFDDGIAVEQANVLVNVSNENSFSVSSCQDALSF
ncbi:uncharacterized protein LOC120344310 [Styela clava]